MSQTTNRQTLLAMRGVPGCGKSTWANAWVAGAPDRARVSRDDIRFELFGDYSPFNDEKRVTQVHDERIKSLLNAGYSVIVDNTHISLKRLRHLKELAGSRRFAVVQLNVPLEMALERNAARDRVVPEDVIRTMYAQLQEAPLPDEWRF